MIRRPLDRAGLCVCGVSVALHFDATDQKRPCRWAGVRLASRHRPIDALRSAVAPLPFPVVSPAPEVFE